MGAPRHKPVATPVRDKIGKNCYNLDMESTLKELEEIAKKMEDLDFHFETVLKKSGALIGQIKDWKPVGLRGA